MDYRPWLRAAENDTPWPCAAENDRHWPCTAENDCLWLHTALPTMTAAVRAMSAWRRLAMMGDDEGDWGKRNATQRALCGVHGDVCRFFWDGFEEAREVCDRAAHGLCEKTSAHACMPTSTRPEKYVTEPCTASVRRPRRAR
jgi:hypothetical protein